MTDYRGPNVYLGRTIRGRSKSVEDIGWQFERIREAAERTGDLRRLNRATEIANRYQANIDRTMTARRYLAADSPRYYSQNYPRRVYMGLNNG